VIDASGKPGSNLLSGILQWLGDYDECQSIGEAHYCLLLSSGAQIKPQNTPIPITKPINISGLRWGLCVPRNCSPVALLLTMGYELRNYVSFNPYLTTVECDSEDHPYSSSAIVVIVLCSVIALWVVLATTVDYFDDSLKVFCRMNSIQGGSSCETSDESQEHSTLLGSTKSIKRNPVLSEFFLAFSLVRNIPKLLDTTSNARNISCLHGIRTLSMMWVILGHCYFFWIITYNIDNLEEASNLPLQFAFQAVANAFFSVDSFFFLSGLLVMYLSLQQMDKTSGHFPWIKFYIHRFWRLTPTLLFALLIYWKLLPYMGNGPLWPSFYSNKNCDKYWWTNLLYINNFHPKYEDNCMGWTWFLAADTQMYILSPIVILPAYFFSILGLFPLMVLLVAVLITIAAIVTVNEFPANVASFKRLPGGGGSIAYENMVYVRFYTRAAPYLIGMAVGYYLARRDRYKRVWSNKLISLIVWLAAFALGITVVYGLYDYNHGHQYPQVASTLYLTFSSALWGVCLAWVVYACTTRNAGIINDILSWRAWFPLSRLTYSAYLLHPVILLLYIGSLKDLVFIDNLHTAYFFVGITGLSYACAAVLSLCVEYPMAALEKAILQTIRV
jgi:peptidoglycan/LPS O-acetylase OafA/YrhL